MAELDKNKAGLQKQVSSVFKGVPLPQNNSARQSSGTPTPDQTPGVSPKPASADKQFSRSSLITKLSQSEDLSENVEQNQTNNVVPKPAAAKQTPQNAVINKLPQPKESLKQPEPAAQPEEGLFLEASGEGLWQQIKDKLFAPKPGVSPVKQKAMVIMVPILAIIMIFTLRQVISKAPRQTEGAGMDDAPVVANIDTGNEIDWEIPEPITIRTIDQIQLTDESDTQNPEQAGHNGTTGEVTTGTIIVRDIVFSKDKPSAVIGSKIVYVGDVINGITIVNIDKDSVDFEKDGERWEQNVREGRKIPILEVTSENQGKSEPIK